MLHEMATGRLPFAEDGTVAVDRNLPPELSTIICKALQTARDLRHASGAEVCADLKRVPNRDHRPVAHAPEHGRWPPHSPLRSGALLTIPLIRTHRATVSTGGAQKTVAVLPFDSIDGGGEMEYLRLALADEVATALSWTPSLAVRPMAASRRFVGRSISPQQAGQQLRVEEIVTGHFSAHQSELRVTVEAVAVDGNRLLWRDSIAARTDDPLAVRDQLISADPKRPVARVGHRRTHTHSCATERRRRVRRLPQEPRDLERPGTKPGGDCDARARECDRP